MKYPVFAQAANTEHYLEIRANYHSYHTLNTLGLKLSTQKNITSVIVRLTHHKCEPPLTFSTPFLIEIYKKAQQSASSPSAFS